MTTLRDRLGNLAAPALIGIGVAFAGPASADEYIKTYPVGDHAAVRIHTDDSSVRVITDDTHQVEFRVRSEGVSAAIQIGGQIKVDSHQDGDQVELTVRVAPGFLLGFNSKSLKTEVHMPRNADLSIDTHDGSVDVSAVNGNVAIHTSDGSIKVSQLKGDTKLHTSDGSIGAHDIDGKLDAASNDGSIHAEGRFDSLKIRSGDGSVSARAILGSRMESAWNVETDDGSVRLAVPPDLQANLDVRTNDGHINIGLPVTMQGYHSKSQVQGTLNGGGPLLTVRSGDGSIRIDEI